MREPVSGIQAAKQQNDAGHLTYPHGGTPLAGQDGFLLVTCLIRCARTATNSCRQQQDRYDLRELISFIKSARMLLKGIQSVPILLTASMEAN